MMHSFLYSNRDELIARCKTKGTTRPHPDATEAQLSNGIPRFLDQLTPTLLAEETNQPKESRCIYGGSRGDTRLVSEMRVSAALHGKEPMRWVLVLALSVGAAGCGGGGIKLGASSTSIDPGLAPLSLAAALPSATCNYSPWVRGTSYEAGSIVIYSGSYFIAKMWNAGSRPTPNAFGWSDWSPYACGTPAPAVAAAAAAAPAPAPAPAPAALTVPPPPVPASCPAAAPWGQAEVYEAGSIVSYLGHLYIAKIWNAGSLPPPNAFGWSDWSPYDCIAAAPAGVAVPAPEPGLAPVPAAPPVSAAAPASIPAAALNPVPAPAHALGALIPKNNQWAIFGDSRVAKSSEDSTTFVANRLTSYGIASWAQHTSNYRAKFVGNYGVNGSTLTDMKSRLTAITTRGQVLNTTASVVMFLGGVNDGTSPITTTGPLYDSIINQLVAAGKIVVVLNELPNSDQNTAGATNLGRRNYLNATIYDTNYVTKLNSYDLASLAQDSYYFQAPYITSPDRLHPNLSGNRDIGTAAGAVLDRLFSGAGFPVRNVLSNGANDSTHAKNLPFSGTAGSLGTGATGQMASLWSGDTLPDGFTVSYSKGFDSLGKDQLICTISGKSGAVGSLNRFSISAYGVGGTWAVSGDTVVHSARVIVDSGNVGLVGVGIAIAAADETNAVYQNASMFSGGGSYDSSALDNGAWAGKAFDGNVVSQPVTLGTGWTSSTAKSVIPAVNFVFLGGTTVSATIRLSSSSISFSP